MTENTANSDIISEDDIQNEESLVAQELFETHTLPLVLFQNEEGEEGQNELIGNMGDWAYATVSYIREFPKYFQIMIDSQNELFSSLSDKEPAFYLHEDFPAKASEAEQENGYAVDLFIVELDETVVSGDIDWGNMAVSGATVHAVNGATFTFSLRHLKALSDMLVSFEESINALTEFPDTGK